MLLVLLLCSCLCTLSALCLFAKLLPSLRSSVLAYGKLQHTADQPQSRIAAHVAQWTVPKSWFGHFYVLGCLVALWCDIEITAALKWRAYGPLLTSLCRWDTVSGSDRVPLEECLLAMSMISIHLARRVYESYCIARPSPTARMHMCHYLVGHGFYGAMVLGCWLEGAAYLGVWQTGSEPLHRHDTLSSCISVHSILAVILFIYASKHQHTCHKILASLRQGSREEYRIPRGDWFESIVTPHYFADILIYLSLCILFRFHNLTLLCGLLWTLLNLSVIAGETDTWYRKTFGPRYKASFPSGRWTIIPILY